MNFKPLILPAICLFAGVTLWSCQKQNDPKHPIHDTVTVVKTDTLLIPKYPDTPDIKSGLVLYLPFNGSIADSSGKGNTVTATGNLVLDYDMHGYAQSAFAATGNGEHLVVSNNGAYKVDSAFTVSFDFMLRSLPYWGGIGYPGLMSCVALVDPTLGNGPTFNAGFNRPDHPQVFAFGINNVAGATCDNIGSSGQALLDSITFTPVVGAWYNAVCIFNKGTASVYINGRLIKTVSGGSQTALFCPNSRFMIGGWWNGDLESLNGKMDEVRFYNRALKSSEVAYLARNFQLNSVSVKPHVQTD